MAASSRRRSGGCRRALPAFSTTTAYAVSAGERQRRKDESEREQDEERALARVDDLGQKAREEDGGLRVADVADQTLPVGDLTPRPERRLAGGPRRVSRPREAASECLSAEKDEVGGTDELDGVKAGSDASSRPVTPALVASAQPAWPVTTPRAAPCPVPA